MPDRNRYDADIPEEPPIKSVVIDREGYAWQSHAGGLQDEPQWYPAVDPGRGKVLHEYEAQAWPRLVASRGPLTGVYEPEEAEPGKALPYLRNLAREQGKPAPDDKDH